MKKLKLKALELGATEVLTRAHLKNVLAGFADATSGGKICHVSCLAEIDVTEYFQFTWNGSTCKTSDDCKNIVCDTAYGPIIGRAYSCS